MSLPARPPSIYDVLGNEEDEDYPNEETLTTSFYLPKDTTKVIHISRSVEGHFGEKWFYHQVYQNINLTLIKIKLANS